MPRIVEVARHRRHVGGRRRPVQNARTHPHLFRSVRSVLSASGLPPAPAAFDFTTGARAALQDPLGNDQIGCCTAAGACHILEALGADNTPPLVFSREQCVAFYALSAGYDPAKPETDLGGDEVTVLQAWRDRGLDGAGGNRILGFLAVDPADAELVRACAWHFGNLYFGAELPFGWAHVADRFTWNAEGESAPDAGHCFVGMGATPEGIIVDSWGLLGVITWAAIAKFCAEAAGGNLFVVLTPEILDRAKGSAPDGLDWPALTRAFEAMGGTVVPTMPAPSSCFERLVDRLFR
jgi:hypothetical protein